jgi:hypothetical protein
VRNTAPKGQALGCKRSAHPTVFATQKHGLLLTTSRAKKFLVRETRILKIHRFFESPYLLKIQKFFTY